jgi:hypothetical protein
LTLITNATSQDVEQITHTANVEELLEQELNVAVIDCIDKAVSLLPDNIGDNSRYLLFEWDVNRSELTVVVTDDAKEKDSKHIVKCTLVSLAKKMKALEAVSQEDWEAKTQEMTDLTREWIHNYLTTCAAFMRFSLIAVFHNDSRNKTRLL